MLKGFCCCALLLSGYISLWCNRKYYKLSSTTLSQYWSKIHILKKNNQGCLRIVWNFTWNSHELIHMNFTWKGFHVKIVWKSCEFSHEFHVKMFHVKFTWNNSRDFHFTRISRGFHVNFTWKLTWNSREALFTWISREAQLAVYQRRNT